jgi:hypothetical protein
MHQTFYKIHMATLSQFALYFILAVGLRKLAHGGMFGIFLE